MKKLLSAIWKKIPRNTSLQWRILRIFHSTFLVGVSGVILDESGKVLLLRHRFWTAAEWGLPGGLAKADEKVEDCLRREVREETGLEIEPVQLLQVESGFRFQINMCFLACIKSGELSVNDFEVTQWAFFDPDDLPEKLLPSHRRAVKTALDIRLESKAKPVDSLQMV